MDIVKEILEKERKELERYKTIEVKKHLDVKTDLGLMMCSDPNDLDEKELKKDQEYYLSSLARDNVQLLLNEIWQLPTERVEECIVAKLPAPAFGLPRQRKCPVAKPLTKWEKFAKEKGIQKKKKDKKVFDTDLDKWVPTYGFRRAQAEKDKDWVLEVPKTADPMEDQFQKKIDLRSEKVAKNEIQRMKNIVRAKKEIMPRAGYFGPETASAKELLTAASIAKASTASVGKFQDKIPKEKNARGIGVKELIPGSKRKPSHLSDVPENIQNVELINSVLKKKPKLDIEKAVSLQKKEAREERETNPTQQKKGSKKTGRKGKKGGGKYRPNSKKPKAGAGQRDPFKRAGGRKRR